MVENRPLKFFRWEGEACRQLAFSELFWPRRRIRCRSDFLLEPFKISPLTFVEQSRPEFISETKGRGNAECYLAPSHAPRMRAIQYPQTSRIEDQRLWILGRPIKSGDDIDGGLLRR